MPSFIFPSNPNIGELTTNPSSGQVFRWTGEAWGGDAASALLTASFAYTASYLDGTVASASYAATASYIAGGASSASYALSSSWSQYASGSGNSTTSSYSVSSSYSLVSETASLATSVLLYDVAVSGGYANDTQAAAGGVPVGGLYRNGNFIQIRIS